MDGTGKISGRIDGGTAEKWASAYLRLKGYRVLERNYRVPQGEIDIIARRNGVLVFVEVKARKATATGTPLEAVTPRKVRRLSAAAAVYLARDPGGAGLCRFDVVTIGPEKNWLGVSRIRHLENAFSAEGDFNV